MIQKFDTTILRSFLDKYSEGKSSKLSMKEITADFSSIFDDTLQYTQTDFEMISNLLSELKSDSRVACQNIATRMEKKIQNYHKESERMFKMFEFEREANSDQYVFVAGLDEAGRGPLVGPVVAAAVILDSNYPWRNINDSKKLTAQQRDQLYEEIIANSIAYGVGIASHEEIDAINILNATKLAMKRAIESMHCSPDYLLIDAVKLNEMEIVQKSIIKGDQKSASIAAASILAKVTRDRLIDELHEVYPQYGFDQHKGYGTPKHYEAIKQYGILNEHRRSFLKNFSFES